MLAESDGQVTDIGVDDQHLWWTIPTEGEVWRVARDGGSPELVAAGLNFPIGVEVGAGFAWTIGLSGLFRIEAGAPAYFIDGYFGPYELAVTETHLYFPSWNLYEDTQLGWIHRYPLMAGEYDPLAGEFVIDKTQPKPSTVRTDPDTIYWATADEALGEGAIWMVCESAL